MKHPLLILLLFAQLAAQSQPKSPLPVAAGRPGTDYAVFFYATDFKPGWASLPETAKEASELKTELETNFGFTCEAVSNPSKAQILAKIKTYNDRLGPDDQVLFFFSMHGHYEESAERGFLIAADGAVQDEYGDTWLSYDDLSGYLARCKAKHVLLALDACHSGAFGIRNKARPDVPSYSQAEDCNQRVAKTFQFAGRQFCTSGNKSSKTPAKSLFASRFLEALRKGGQDGIIRFDDLEYYLGKVENPRPENGTFKGHEPGGDFIFVRKNACITSASLSKKNSADYDKTLWYQTQTKNTLEAYRDYLRECSLCLFNKEAESILIHSGFKAPMNTSPEGDKNPINVNPLEQIIGVYTGFDEIVVTTSGADLARYNLSIPAVITAKNESKISISNFGGFNSFIEASAIPENSGGLSILKITIDFVDSSNRTFTGNAIYNNRQISGRYKVSYADSTFEEVKFEYIK